jgi:hypothetical protein
MKTLVCSAFGVGIACSPSHRPAAPERVEATPRIDAGAPDAATEGAAERAEAVDADACSNETIDATSIASSFDDCWAIDLDGKPPCEAACRSLSTGPEPLFRTREQQIYFTTASRPVREIGRIQVYDGPLDATSARSAADHSVSVFVDHATSPPTLELRPGACLFECKHDSSSAHPSGAECRARCAPTARYRYFAKQLRKVR